MAARKSKGKAVSILRQYSYLYRKSQWICTQNKYIISEFSKVESDKIDQPYFSVSATNSI